jgi:membrane associated rhomboid family serine protease
MIVNVAVFLFQTVAGWIWPHTIEYQFGLSHEGLIHQFKLWQLFTYMFLHGGFLHIFFNLFTLWMFSGELEEYWGSARFLRYYLISGAGAGFCIAGMNYFIYLRYGMSPVTLGASGAVYAILLAYGMTWPNRQVLLYFLFPIKMKYLVLIFGLFEFFGTIKRGGGSNVSHIGHLGGLLSGFILIQYMRSRASARTRNGAGPIDRLLKKIRINRKKRQINTRIEAKEIIDTLLEKIAKSGMSSLTRRKGGSSNGRESTTIPDGTRPSTDLR